MRVRVIGVGTRRGDDAVGLAVAERLARGPLPPGVRVALCERPGAELLDELDGAEAVVLVDATAPAGAPGTVRRLAERDLAPARALSSHALGVAEALRLAEALGRRPASVEIVGVAIADGDGDGESAAGNAILSEKVRAAIDPAAGLARSLAARLGAR